MTVLSLTNLPSDVIIVLAEHIHNIEDFMNLSSTCKKLRDCMEEVTSNSILRMAAAQSCVFFRPSPHFLVAAVASELGQWARSSPTNEAVFVNYTQRGLAGLMELATLHCGLAMARIRELHFARYETLNHVTDVVDKCVGDQWRALPNFWDEVEDAYTIDCQPSETLFHLAIYGELFGPDFVSFLRGDGMPRMSIEARLEFIKYCIPDVASLCIGNGTEFPDGTIDPRREVRRVGPYALVGTEQQIRDNHNIALTWLLRSTRWKPIWKEMREEAAITDFEPSFEDGWWYHADDHPHDWRQRLLEGIMVCQGLAGLEMLVPRHRHKWIAQVREWWTIIGELKTPPTWTRVGRQATHDYPYLLGDLRICASGYVLGT